MSEFVDHIEQALDGAKATVEWLERVLREAIRRDEPERCCPCGFIAGRGEDFVRCTDVDVVARGHRAGS